ncbi:MAG: MYXO-CTERM domain-containing protein [Myxococcota bacterium]|jgi:MYXO-CTERM domain-containing protein
MCNGLDDDCDDSIDIDATDAVVVFPDTDQDGQGDADSAGEATCTPGDEPVLTATDCDDTNATVFVGADELCDSLDNDCNGRVDDGVEFEQWYVDGDEDGFGGQATGPPDCAPPIAGAVTTSGDCDDTDPNAFPGAEEIQQDGIDQDCDGLDELPDPDSTRDFEPDEDPDTGIDPQSGCNCDVSSAPSPAWALAVLGLLLGRRRRDA